MRHAPCARGSIPETSDQRHAPLDQISQVPRKPRFPITRPNLRNARLAVLDGLAGTLLIRLAVHYDLPDSGLLVSMDGGAEAFFDFTNPQGWHLYLGEKEPVDKRIRAQIL